MSDLSRFFVALSEAAEAGADLLDVAVRLRLSGEPVPLKGQPGSVAIVSFGNALSVSTRIPPTELLVVSLMVTADAVASHCEEDRYAVLARLLRAASDAGVDPDVLAGVVLGFQSKEEPS